MALRQAQGKLKRRLVLIDGHAIIHRAYHALPVLNAPGGQQVNAVYGFLSMLLKVVDDLQPTYLAVALDLPIPTFRHEEYIAYQAHRPEVDQELRDQVSLVKEAVKAASIPIYTAEGYEADDVIGTLARQAVEGKWEVRGEKLDKRSLALRAKEVGSGKKSHISRQRPASHIPPRTSDIEVVVVTGDRDMLQLVNRKVRVYAPIRGLSEARLFDAKEVKDYMGVEPAQIVDYKALIGDPSDNYAGVPGVGPKSAVALLGKYGSLENIYKAVQRWEGRGERLEKEVRSEKKSHISPRHPASHITPLTSSLVEKLKQGQESAMLSQRLAKIVTDAPVKLDLEKMKFRDFRKNERFLAKLQEFGFRSLIKRINPPEKVKKKLNGNGQMGLL